MEDDEIARLEKKLNRTRGKKQKRVEADDGLDEIVGDLGHDQKNVQSDSGSDFDIVEEEKEEDDAESVDENADPKVSQADRIYRPYVAPHENNYVPPVSRTRGSSEVHDETQARLQKRMQGLINKFSEANLISIIAYFQSQLLLQFPRQMVIDTFAKLIINIICSMGTLNELFVISHAALVVGVERSYGQDIGAHILQSLVTHYDANVEDRKNLVSMLAPTI